MTSTQQHIIHKVIVDVETKNEGAAFQLKDRIDVFLKEEIFPSLEQYFKSLETELQTQTIQISKLDFDVSCTSENDFRELKEEIKKQAFKELKKVIKSHAIEKENVKFLNTDKSVERALIYFLEKGTPPWWDGSNETVIFKEKTLVEVSHSTSFIKSFKKKISSKNVQNRLINQFLNEEIQILLQGVYRNERVKISIVNDEIIDKINRTIPEIRKSIWKTFIDYFLYKNEEAFLRKLIDLIQFGKTNKNQKKTTDALIEIVQLIGQRFNEETSKSLTLEKLTNERSSLREDVKNTSNFIQENETITNQEVDSDSIEEGSLKKQDEIFNSYSSESVPNTERNTEESLDSNLGLQKKIIADNSSDDTGNVEKTKEDKIKLSQYREESLDEGENISKPKKSLEKKSDLISNTKEGEKQKNTISEKEELERGSLKNDISEFHAKFDFQNKGKELKFIEDELSKEEIFPEEKGEYYVQNAGLILLHPYLKDFFTNCEILNDDSKITDPELAVHLLHYIATKNEKQFESKMVFEKFLCGVPIQKSIRRDIDISKELKQKTEDLLKAIIANWTSLNNASPDLLRNEFLQRSGKISFKDVNPKIIVERKVHDILLDKIPWTLSLCKLPWISKLIFTDW